MSTITFEFPEPGYEDHRTTSGDAKDEAWIREWDSVLKILTDYVQPDSTLSLDDAVTRVAQFWNDSRATYTTAVLMVPVAMAEQMPYNHPSHPKLAHFMLALHDSGKTTDKNHVEHHENQRDRFWELFTWYLWENDWRPERVKRDDEDPIHYANFCAFVANLTFPEGASQSFDYLLAKAALSDAEAMKSTDRAEVRDARMLGAAQYMIVRSQTIYEEVRQLQKRQEEFKKTQGRLARLLHPKRKLERHPEKEFSWDEWERWKQMFRTAAGDETHSRDCREFAQRAGDMMALQEKIEGNQSAAS